MSDQRDRPTTWQGNLVEVLRAERGAEARAAELEAELLATRERHERTIRQLRRERREDIAERDAERDEARNALRALLAGHRHSSDDVRRQAIEVADETVRRWDAGEPQVTGHCPTCAGHAQEAAHVSEQRNALLAAVESRERVCATQDASITAAVNSLGEHATGDLAADVARVVAELERAERRRREERRAATQRLVGAFGADGPCDLEDAVERAVRKSDELRDELERVRGDLKAERRAAHEREAPPVEPARPLAVGDRVRVVRCCAAEDRPCCQNQVGLTGELLEIDAADHADWPRHPFFVKLHTRTTPGDRFARGADRVEPVSEPAAAAERPLTHEAMARLIRAVLGDSYRTTTGALEEVARRLEVHQ